MQEPKGIIVEKEQADTELELSAQELRELAQPGANQQATTPQPQAPTTTSDSSAPIRRATVPGRFLSLTFVAGSIGAFCLVLASNDHEVQPVEQTVERPVPRLEQPEPTIEGEPVLFANPFDAHEVFEFPAGTTHAEAREAVAQMLLERAMERQRDFDTFVTKND